MSLDVIVGVYASQPANERDKQEYYTMLAAEEWINGAEIPYPGELAYDDNCAWLARVLPKNWHSNTVTLIPGTMQEVGKNQRFGLASCDILGRHEALLYLRTMRDNLDNFLQRRGAADIRYIQIHTAPKGCADAAAMSRSLDEICSWDWGGAQIVIEHCDKQVEGQPAEKGFLPIEDEIKLACNYDLGITVNWGRSVLEARSVAQANAHIQQCVQANALTGLMFSGVSAQALGDYSYAWQDAHVPLSVDEPHSLMTPDAVNSAVRDACESKKWLADGYVGAKICVPAAAHLNTRIDYLRHVYKEIRYAMG
ncbi:DUF4862 family protein [Alloscardovia venturai]|uniref:DUF4862 family protein n=1 Tax=Alloscardovia venturai TaxID=1769421 RepID=A0ABW2Y430_9BIFI